MAKSDKKADKKAAKSKAAKPAPSPAKLAPLPKAAPSPKAKKLKSNGKTPVKPIDSDSDDSSEDEQPKKTVVSSSDSDSDSDSDESPEEKKPAKAPAAKKGKAKADSSDSSDSSSDESSSDEDVKMQDVQPTKSKKAADLTKGAKPVVSQPKAKLPISSKEILANAKTLKANGKAPESSDESSDSSSEDEQPKKATSSSDSDESSEEETPASVPAGKVAKGKAESNGSSDSSSEEDSSDEDEGDAKVDDAQPAKGTKRKAEAEPAAPPKKVKLANGDAAPSESTEETKSIFVGRLSWNVDNDWLAQEFAACGEVVSAHVQTDRATGKSRGFGYVHFAMADAVEKALEMNGKEIDGRPVNIDKSTPPDKSAVRENRAKSFGDTQSPASNVLFVGNLSFGVNEDQLWELFGEHGDVKSVRVPTDRDSGRPKGFAYVEFSVLDAAKTAHEQLQGHELDGRSLRLDFSQPRDNAGGGGGRGRGSFGDRGRGGFGDRGRGRGGFGGGDRGRGGFGGDRGGRGRGRGGDRGGRGGGRGRGGPRTGAVAPFEGSKIRFD